METIVRIGHVWSFDELPDNTIALDGAVNGPAIDAERRRFSFDHHAGCIRLVTSATCQQVFDALLLGLDPSQCTLLLNDVDGDTTLSLWLLQRHDLWRERGAITRVWPLVAAVGASDAHGLVHPLAREPLATHFYVIIMEPVRNNRPTAGKDGQAHRTLAECLARLSEWWESGLVPAASLPKAEKFPSVTLHGTWAFADSGSWAIGPTMAGSGWLYEQGHDRIVLCTHLTGGRWQYTLARRSDLVGGFPLPEIYDALNAAEAEIRSHALSPQEAWGGGSSVGGSPRDGGSMLAPEKVVQIIESVVARAPRP